MFNKEDLLIHIIDFKINLKYQLKEAAIQMVLKKYSDIEVKNLRKTVKQAVSFWTSLSNERIQEIENEEYKEKKKIYVSNFERFLEINTLYQLVVKKQESVYIHMSWDPMENLVESVNDSCFSPFGLFKNHMKVFKDRVILNDILYYDVNNTEEMNENNINVAEGQAMRRSLSQFVSLFNPNK